MGICESIYERGGFQQIFVSSILEGDFCISKTIGVYIELNLDRAKRFGGNNYKNIISVSCDKF